MTVEDALIWLLAGVAGVLLLLGLAQSLVGWPSRRPPHDPGPARGHRERA